MNQEQNAVLMVAIMAALCDGQQDAGERAAIEKLSLGAEADYTAALRAVQSGHSRLDDIARSIVSTEGKRLAFEAATAVCNADGACNAAEQSFLDGLRAKLQLDTAAATIQQQAKEIATVPVTTAPAAAATTAAAAPDAAQLDKMIMDAAILNGALELLPETLASMAILPLQMKLVYRVAKAHNLDLGREHVRDFVATLGVGLTAQFLEGFARKLLGGLLGGAGRQAASSGMAFVSTYAIGQAARRYYAGGRKLEALQLRETYQSLLAEAKTLAGKAQDEIRKRAGTINTRSIIDMVKSA